MELIKDLGMFGLITLIGIVGFFLRQKDDKQAKEIALLFKKSDENAAAHGSLRLEIAKEHYMKGELDTRFAHLERTFKEGFDTLGKKFDDLSIALLRHIDKGDGK